MRAGYYTYETSVRESYIFPAESRTVLDVVIDIKAIREHTEERKDNNLYRQAILNTLGGLVFKKHLGMTKATKRLYAELSIFIMLGNWLLQCYR